MLTKFLSGFHLLLINAEEHGWTLTWLFVSLGDEAGQSKNIKGLMHVVSYVSSLNISLNF